jgi:hypothetical protein
MASHGDGRTAEEPTAHVIFELEVEDGWPPVALERVWAYDVGDNRYVIDNVPWFARDLAVGDLVRTVSPDPRSHPIFQRLLDRSDHVTIRLICFRNWPLGGDLALAKEPFTRLGVYAKGVTQYGMLAENSASLGQSHRPSVELWNSPWR